MALALSAASCGWAQVEVVDKIVAIVEDDVVLASELAGRILSIRARFADEPGALPPEEVLRSQVLERLVSESIQLQRADRYGIRISDDQVNQSFAQLAQSQNMTSDQLMAELSNQGQSLNGVLRDLRRELRLQQVQQAEVDRRIFISESEIQNFLDSAEGQYWQQPGLNLKHIQFSLASNAGPAEVATAETLSQRVYRELLNGENFESLAVQYSSGPTALDGGSIGWRRAMDFPPEIAAALENAVTGTLTEPIRSSGGLHIFQVADIRTRDQAGLIKQTRARHILIKPNQIRSSEDARKIVDDLRERVIAGESFESLAEEYSEDIANKLKGGDLEWILPGQMVPPFERALDVTDVGELSEPVETRFGWHLIRVDDRREVDMSSDIMRNQARTVLFNRRYPEELDLWVREIRSDAFVSILD